MKTKRALGEHKTLSRTIATSIVTFVFTLIDCRVGVQKDCLQDSYILLPVA